MKGNPVYKQETMVSVRSFRLPLVIFVFNSVLAAAALLSMYSVIAQVRVTAEIQYSSFLSLYIFVAAIEFAMLLFIIPAVTAGSISGERERQTLNLMLTTRMTAVDIVLGKLSASLSTIFLLIASSFPIFALIFIYGGVTAKDILLLLVCYGVTALLMGCIGIFCSACFKRSTFATVAGYCLTAVFVLGTVAVNHMIYLLRQAASVSGTTGSGSCLYLLLLNPASTFWAALEGQMGSGKAGSIFPWLETCPQNLVTEHWMVFGIVAQSAMAALFLWQAVGQVDPHGRRKRNPGVVQKKKQWYNDSKDSEEELDKRAF